MIGCHFSYGRGPQSNQWPGTQWLRPWSWSRWRACHRRCRRWWWTDRTGGYHRHLTMCQQYWLVREFQNGIGFRIPLSCGSEWLLTSLWYLATQASHWGTTVDASFSLHMHSFSEWSSCVSLSHFCDRWTTESQTCLHCLGTSFDSRSARVSTTLPRRARIDSAKNFWSCMIDAKEFRNQQDSKKSGS